LAKFHLLPLQGGHPETFTIAHRGEIASVATRTVSQPSIHTGCSLKLAAYSPTEMT
jgi:hypothetical protein